jgi:hypothetical protein
MSTVPSTTIMTNLKNVAASTSNTRADAFAGGMDMAGMLALALTKAYALKQCLTLIVGKTDGADPNLTTLNDVLASLT